MLEETAHRGPDACGTASVGWQARADAPSGLRVAPRGLPWAMGHARLAITGTLGDQPMPGSGPDGLRFVVGVNGEIWNWAALRRREAGGARLRQDSDSLVVPLVLSRHLEEEGAGDEGVLSAVSRTAEELDGEFAFAYMDGTRTVLCRDPFGVKPLYYAARAGTVAFSSERKALWALGLEAVRVPPNSAVLLSPGRVATRGRSAVMPPEPRPFASRQAAKAGYGRALARAVGKRVRGHKQVGVVFSGGVDSALIAGAVGRTDTQPVCIVAGREGSPDVEAARGAADAMGLTLVVARLDAGGVAEALPALLRAVEERNQLHVETALPLYFVAKEARRRGLRVLLTGQAADELFAGYAWYPRILQEEGEAALRARMDDDRDMLHAECLEREDKVTMAHSVELRVPYLDPLVVRAAARIPISYQVSPGDPLGKRLHRELAASWGLPHEVAWRVKVAAQHGSGSRALLARASRSAGPVPSGYDAVRSVGERMGSNQRYGHRYMPDAEAWDLDGPIQWALDQLWHREGLGGPEGRAALAADLEALSAEGALA
ncbi:MAG TPA: asparagine synthase-related protein [Candidatus Thermoplasmatota archaeon]